MIRKLKVLRKLILFLMLLRTVRTNMNSSLLQRHTRKNIDSTVAIYTQCTLFAAGNYAIGIKVAGQKRTESHNLTPSLRQNSTTLAGEGARVERDQRLSGQTQAQQESA